MSKTYILKKDTPEFKAGIKFEKNGRRGYVVRADGNLSSYLTDHYYPENIVENNPEWFEEVKDEFTAKVVDGKVEDVKMLYFSRPLTEIENKMLLATIDAFVLQANKMVNYKPQNH